MTLKNLIQAQGTSAWQLRRVLGAGRRVIVYGAGVHTEWLCAGITCIRQFKNGLFGSVALSLAHLVSARVDAHLEDGIMLWDIAAGMAIVDGAGGIATTERLPGAMPNRCSAQAAARKALLPNTCAYRTESMERILP